MKIQWTEQAAHGWQQVAQYILRDFGRQGLSRYERLTKKAEEQIAKFPGIGTIAWDDSDETVLYRFVFIHDRSKMLYFVKDDVIYIADFWDVRSNH